MTEKLPKQAILIVNAKSRQGADAFDRARDLLTERGVELLESHALEDPKKLQPAVMEAVEKAPMVIVGGGDGTLSSVVDDFLGTHTVFAVLPLGTANSFARALGLPLDLEGAVGVIVDGKRKRIDLGAVDEDYFVNTAAIGLSPMIARTVPAGLKRALGRFGYLIWAVRCAFKFRPFHLTVEDGSTITRVWATEVRIANGSHMGGVEIVEGASLDSGEIVIQSVVGKSKLRLAWNWCASVFRLGGEESVTEFRGQRLGLATRPVMEVAIDGEPAARTPVVVSVVHGAVEVAAPKES